MERSLVQRMSRQNFMRVSMLVSFCAITWCLSSDETILLDLSEQLKGESTYWKTNNGSPCSWNGVQCIGDGVVTNLTLQHFRLSGSINASIAQLQNLTVLDLSTNSLSGAIPHALGNLPALELLNLSFNDLSGTIPPDFKNLVAVKGLSLSHNSLSDIIPDGLGDLSALEYLDLSFNNLTGVIPPELGNLAALELLDLSSNVLTGAFPPELGNLAALELLDLSFNNLTGIIPEGIGNLIKLQSFSAYRNNLSGPIPQMNSQSLQSVNLASNSLLGEIPSNICESEQLKILILSYNKLNGTLPKNLSSCSSLTTLRVGSNLLSGDVPNGLGQLENLVYFEANDNNLVGPIPTGIAGWKSLNLLNLADNRLTGVIPVELSNASNIQELILSNNQLSGHIPLTLLSCKNLSVLDLSRNGLSGSIPGDICTLLELNSLRLQDNSLTGMIPFAISACGKLLELNLGNNIFTGSIPSTIGSLSSLQVSLNLSQNQLTGKIPSSLSKLSQLVSLDLSHNQLSGEIPNLSTMLSLLAWNFSNNQLSGPVPQIGPDMLNSSSSNYASSYANNSGLCGDPLPPCGGVSATKEQRVVSFWRVAGIAVSCAVVVLVIFSGVAIALMHKRRFSSAVDPAPSLSVSRVFMDSFEQAINFDSIKEATCNSANIISSNHFSTIYKAVMPSGLVLGAKRLHSTEKGLLFNQRKMGLELDKLWKLAHANIMRPMGYFLQNDLAIILYDFVPLSSLSQQLHRNSERLLTWSKRYEIALGAAQGLAFLHHSCYPPVIHMNVTSNNILLGPSFEVQIGDVEVAKLLDPTKNTGSISAVAGSFGYIAPEYAFTMQVTFASNIYSFGVVLLELVTGRLPIDETFGDGLDLVKWVHGASSRGETPEQILDARISTLSFASRQEMLAVLKVALVCTNASPSKRPRMKKILDMLLESKLPAEAHSIAN